MELVETFQSLGLWKYFPSKLKRIDLFAIQHAGELQARACKKPESHLYADEYINGIVHYDGNCRFSTVQFTEEKFSKENLWNQKKSFRSLQIHPLDISTSLFLCCDHAARQDLVLHFWGCKHAFPLIIKTEQLEPPAMYICPMADLYLNSEVYEKPILDYKLKIISVIRFSNQDVSKSNLLNVIMYGNEKNHQSFFHRNCTGSAKILSNFCYGMVEAMPALDPFDNAVLYLNLRGNGMEHICQLNFLEMSSCIVIIVCKLDEISLIETFVNSSTRRLYELLIIVFTDLNADDEDEGVHVRVDNFSKALNVRNDIIAYKGLSQADFVADISSVMNVVHRTRTLEDLKRCAKSNFITLDFDSFETTRIKTKKFIERLMQNGKENFMSSFPLQGQECVAWSKADLEIERLRKVTFQIPTVAQNVHVYREHLDKVKRDMRQKQLQLLLSEQTWAVREFLDIVHKTKSDELEVFLRSMKHEMEILSLSNLKRLHKKYRDLMQMHKVDQTNKADIESKLEELEIKLNDNSFSLNVIVREMGQIYETIVSQNISENPETNLIVPSPGLLTDVAVSLLFAGFEVEIMDGRTKHVSINWINGILLELHRKIGNANVKVITVLGIQSTGKSTLLNIMFGSNFEVSYGCCTRGAQIYLVKVCPETAEQYSADYFIIIDTEGLYSTSKKWQLGERSREERELATFVIGLSHITIINIMGEHVNYLRDILPICVHAFLRMNLAGLNAKCIILHHGVDKSKSDRLLPQTVSLESELDWHTHAACEIERVQIKRFRDIIRFDLTNDVEYFPALYETTVTETINPAFSRAVVLLKQKILDDRDAIRTLKEFIDHLNNLWNAIKRDNFVYEFKNTVETTARTIMDRRLCKRQWQLRRKIQTHMGHYKLQISNTDNLNHLQEILQNYRCETKLIQSEEEKLNREEFSNAVPNILLAKAMRALQDSCVRNANKTIQECQTICNLLIDRDFHYRKTEINILHQDEGVLGSIDSFLHNSFEVQKSNKSNSHQIADTLFHEWCDSLWSNDVYRQNFDFEKDALNNIYSSYFIQLSQIDELYKAKSIRKRNVDSFLSNILESHWLHKSVDPAQKAMANDVAQECLMFVKHLVIELKTMKQFYHVDMFKDIILEVRNHKKLFYGDLRTKPVFEIELVMSLCGEFIARVENICWDKCLYSERLMKNTEIYFKSRCHEKLKDLAILDLKEVVDGFVECLIAGSVDVIYEALPQTIASHLKNEYKFLNSKPGLLYFMWSKFIDESDTLAKYLSSPHIAARITISELVERVVNGDMDNNFSVLKTCIEQSVSQLLQTYADKIMQQISFLTCHQLRSNQVETIVRILEQSLSNMLDIEPMKVYEYVSLKDTDVLTAINFVISAVQNQSTRNLLVEKILCSLRENLDAFKYETVTIVIECFRGCNTMCPFCGEICCIADEAHEGKHKPSMHKPIGFQKKCADETKDSPLTCWEVLEQGDQEVSLKLKNWLVMPDTSVNDNSFWKYMYISYVEENINPDDVKSEVQIPESWRALTKRGEVKKLEELIKRFSEDD